MTCVSRFPVQPYLRQSSVQSNPDQVRFTPLANLFAECCLCSDKAVGPTLNAVVIRWHQHHPYACIEDLRRVGIFKFSISRYQDVFAASTLGDDLRVGNTLAVNTPIVVPVGDEIVSGIFERLDQPLVAEIAV